MQIRCGPGLKQNITRTIMEIEWNSNIAVVLSVLLLTPGFITHLLHCKPTVLIYFACSSWHRDLMVR